MSQIKIDIDVVEQLNGNLNQGLSKLSQVISGLSALENNVDSAIMARRSIRSRLHSSSRSLGELEVRISALHAFISKSMERYAEAESYLVKMATVVGTSAAIYSYDDWLKHKKSDENNNTSPGIDQKGAAQAVNSKSSWLDNLADILSDSNLGFVKDVLEGTTVAGIAGFYKVPKFIVDGKYLKVLNSENYHGGLGIARRYTMDNIMNGKYPNASKLYNVSKNIDLIGKVGKIATVLSVASEAYKELATHENISTERKVSNATIAAGGAIATAIAGAEIGGAIGTFIPIPVVGTVVGAVVGAGVSLAADYLLKAKFWNGGTKSSIDVVQDVVGDGVEYATKEVGKGIKATGKWLGSLFKHRPVTGAVCVT